MADPFLVLRRIETRSRPKEKPRHIPKPHTPGHTAQGGRLNPKFDALEKAFENKLATVQANPAGANFEDVVVFEIACVTEEFLSLAKSFPGLEALSEMDWDEIQEASGFYIEDKEGKKSHKTIPTKMFVVMANQQAIRELLSLWKRYKSNAQGGWPQGKTRWRDLFTYLVDVRRWGVKDRLEDTGIIEDFRERQAAKEERVICEIELWFREDKQARDEALKRVSLALEQQQGKAIGSPVAIPEICYHGIAAELPMGVVDEFARHAEVGVLACEQVMFFRPVGQSVLARRAEAPGGPQSSVPKMPNSDLPVQVAILDGLPLENHRLLQGRIVVEDTDGWAGLIEPKDRCHGTAMASLVIHGNLESSVAPLPRRVYVAPILATDPKDPNSPRIEHVPVNLLVLDLVHRRLRRMLGLDGQPAGASVVAIVNLSVCDKFRPFGRMMSPWARLLDYYAWHHKLLFVVAGGNQLGPLELKLPSASLTKSDPVQIEKAVIMALQSDGLKRRVLSPSESINAITVGAAHAPNGASPLPSAQLDPFRSESDFPSPISPFGLGHRKSIKPEVLHEGGRQTYTDRVSPSVPVVIELPRSAFSPKGLRHAAPTATPGRLDGEVQSTGTSNAAALVTRNGAQILESLEPLRQQVGGDFAAAEFSALLAKAVLIHSAKQMFTAKVLDEVLTPHTVATDFRNRWFGYGKIDQNRLFGSTDRRASMLAVGRIEADKIDLFEIPLPACLDSKKVHRRLTLTLVWFTPINPKSVRYRRAALEFNIEANHLSETLAVKSVDVRRDRFHSGTVHHAVFEGEKAAVFPANQVLPFVVECKSDAGEMKGPVPYVLAVSVESREALPILSEIQQAIRIRQKT